MTALNLTPVDTNYLSSELRYQQLTQNTDVVTVNTDNFTAATTPKVMTFGDGDVRLLGRVTVSGTPAANFEIGTLPTWCKPLQGSDQVYPVCILRAGAYIGNAVALNAGGDSIESVTITAPGSYATLPSLSVSGVGTGAILTTRMKAVSATASSAGTSYAAADTITLTGGTAATNAILTVASSKVISASINAAGTGQVPADVLTCVGGTASTTAQFTVATTKVVSATVAAGGTGGTTGTQTVTGTTGTGTKFQASVTISGGGAITAVLSITVAGSYTVNPTAIAAEPVTENGGGGLTGATLNVVMGAATATLTRAGVYTANTSSFTTTSSGAGTGVTFNTVVFGVNAVTVSATAGSYTVLPSNPVAQGSSSGSGTGAEFTVLWGLIAPVVDNGGSGYTSSSSLVITGGGGSGGGAGTLVLESSDNGGILTLVNEPTAGDIVVLDSVNFIVESYNSQ